MEAPRGGSGSKRLNLLLVAGLAAIASLAGWLVVTTLRREAAPPTSLSMPQGGHSASEDAGSSAPVLDSTEALDVRENVEGSLQSPISESAEKCRIEELRAKMEDYAASEKWNETYSAYSWADLWRESEVLVEAMQLTTKPEFERRFEAGQYDVVGTDQKYAVKNFNPFEVSSLKTARGGLWLKVVLPEAEFQAEYKLKAQVQWLREESRKRKVSRPRVTRRASRLHSS